VGIAARLPTLKEQGEGRCGAVASDDIGGKLSLSTSHIINDIQIRKFL
jgi:hypothetical protein